VTHRRTYYLPHLATIAGAMDVEAEALGELLQLALLW
jgi:hypothetical protein